MKTYFIRHKCKEDIARNLMSSSLIALEFENQSWDEIHKADFWNQPKNKANAKYKQSVDLFKQIVKEGGIIFAEYHNGILNDKNNYGCLLGIVEPGTKVQKKFGREVTLEMKIITEIHYKKYPVLLAIRPPYGTIFVPQRKTYSLIAEHIINKRKPTPTLELLHPTITEQLCVEFLKHKGLGNNKDEKLHYLFLSTGKTLPDVDIAGRLYNNKIIKCQVKNANVENNKRAIDKLVKMLEPGEIGVYFAQNITTDVKTAHPQIIFYDLDDIFTTMLAYSEQMITDMIGIG